MRYTPLFVRALKQSGIFVVVVIGASALFVSRCAEAQESSSENNFVSTDADAVPNAPQAKQNASQSSSSSEDGTLRNLPRNLLKDQEAIWTSPAHIRLHDLKYLVPLGLATTVVMTTDHQVMNSSKLNDTSLNNHANTASNGLVGGFLVAPVAIYGIGAIHHDTHATETGVLAGEAIGDSLVVNEVLKIASLRERPNVDDARGKFFQTSVGFDSSFPSNHSIIAWSSASVIAAEYPGALTQIAAYGLATGVSVTRVLGKQHFPSDVLVGSAVGWLIGHYVERRHHREARY